MILTLSIDTELGRKENCPNQIIEWTQMIHLKIIILYFE